MTNKRNLLASYLNGEITEQEVKDRLYASSILTVVRKLGSKNTLFDCFSTVDGFIRLSSEGIERREEGVTLFSLYLSNEDGEPYQTHLDHISKLPQYNDSETWIF